MGQTVQSGPEETFIEEEMMASGQMDTENRHGDVRMQPAGTAAGGQARAALQMTVTSTRVTPI